MAERPQYRVLHKSFIDNHLREEGAVIEYDGPPSGNLIPLNAAAKKKAGQEPTTEKDRERMHIAAAGANPDTGLAVGIPGAEVPLEQSEAPKGEGEGDEDLA